MNVFLTTIRAYSALGLVNLVRVFFYRVGAKTRFGAIRRIRSDNTQGPFFLNYQGKVVNFPALELWQQRARWFGWYSQRLNGSLPPDWCLNPFTGVRMESSQPLEWWQIDDFDSSVGDIKIFWELSRFEWVLAFAQKTKRGDETSIDRLNLWLEDWCRKNPPYYGCQWKCGQEASIRVMHLAIASLILGQVHDAAQGLIKFIEIHLQRIEPTISYAIAQDNNHGTSEAAALYIGGSWLSSLGCAKGQKWQCTGAKWLINRAMRLIMPDGSFSQYSVNYHRVVLDTFSMVEVWRQHLNLPEFPSKYLLRVKQAANWLNAMVQSQTGGAPNIGANDGARLLPLACTDYRDYRPSVQLAMVLFANCRAYVDYGSWDLPLDWLGVESHGMVKAELKSGHFDKGGYAILRKNKVMVVLRYPKFRFRPSHADALHVDLWKEGINFLRDAGTFSYNTSRQWLDYFSGTQSHNTIQFDDRDQMPRVGRFLFGGWLKTTSLKPVQERGGRVSVSAGYKDLWGATHERQIELLDSSLRVIDIIDGFKSKAVLRWRLRPGSWHLEGLCVSNMSERILIHSNAEITRIELVVGWESLYYQQKTEVPVLEVEVAKPGVLQTEYYF